MEVIVFLVHVADFFLQVLSWLSYSFVYSFEPSLRSLITIKPDIWIIWHFDIFVFSYWRILNFWRCYVALLFRSFVFLNCGLHLLGWLSLCI
jgi:hypothetical protein